MFLTVKSMSYAAIVKSWFNFLKILNALCCFLCIQNPHWRFSTRIRLSTRRIISFIALQRILWIEMKAPLFTRTLLLVASWYMTWESSTTSEASKFTYMEVSFQLFRPRSKIENLLLYSHRDLISILFSLRRSDLLFS